jgi:hypothetical protein
MRSALIALFVVAFAALAPTGALADPPPPFTGDMRFQAIQGPDGPEEFSWEVSLYEGQALRAIDEQSAEVYYTDPEHHAFSITAELAHDSEGKAVPTTLAITQPNIITLTVHHRDGPAAGGNPFDYPVLPGEGWEGGFQPVEILGPPDESSLSSVPAPGELPPPPATCVVPDLTGRTLRASRKILHQSHCRLGAVRGEQVRSAHVVTQYRQIGRSVPLWTKVDVKALTGLQYSRSS